MNMIGAVKEMLKKLRSKWHRDLTVAMDGDGTAIKKGQEKLLTRINELEKTISAGGGTSQLSQEIQNSDKKGRTPEAEPDRNSDLDEFARKAEIYRAYSLFEERESQKLFWARLHLGLNYDFAPMLQHLILLDRKGDPKDLVWMLKNRGNYKASQDELIIYGFTYVANEMFSAIRKLGYKIDAICRADDTDPMFKPFIQPEVKIRDLQGVPVITEAELLNRHKAAQVIVCYTRCRDVKNYLINKGFPRDRLWVQSSAWDKQYLDPEIMQPHQHEVYVDGGVYNLQDTVDFIKWCNGEYDAVYAFEPDDRNFEKCKERLRTDPALDPGRIHLFHAALWKGDEELKFQGGAQVGSTLRSDGNSSVHAKSIDSVLQGRPVTFIKMDIEGAELDALKGAKESIKKWKPRLAICIYHKADDSIEIPLYIHGLVPEYKMFIRHYTTCRWETVLYCVCDRDL